MHRRGVLSNPAVKCPFSGQQYNYREGHGSGEYVGSSVGAVVDSKKMALAN